MTDTTPGEPVTPICFLDTETDGVHPDRKAWEVAIIRRDDQGERRFHAFMDIALDTADPFGLKVGRFYDRHPIGWWISGAADKPLPEQPGTPDSGYVNAWTAAHLVAKWTHGAHLVGAVPNFDSEVLANLLRDNCLTPSWHYHLIDVETLAVGFLQGVMAAGAGTGTSHLDLPWTSDDLSRACGIEPPADDDRHTAMGDAEWAMRWYDAITGAQPWKQPEPSSQIVASGS